MNALTSLVSKRGKPASDPSPKGKPFSRIAATLIPFGIGAGFLLLFFWMFGSRLLPTPAVEVVTVVTLPATGSTSQPTADSPSPAATSAKAYEAEPLFQASGWIEADPFPIRAVALTDGVIEEVFILEGETVQKGQILARLIQEDAQLELEATTAAWERKKAELTVAISEVGSRQANMNLWEARITMARAQLEEALDERNRLQVAGSEAIPERRIRQAQFRVQAKQAEVAAAEAAYQESRSHWEAAQNRVEVIQGEVDTTRVERDQAQLALDRTEIYSPIDGVVQRLLAAPGKKKMLQMDNPESATIALLYHPEKLQARIDVPLEQAAQLRLNQPVWIRSNFLADTPLRGRVTRIVGEADLQRNTLQTKVAIEDPNPRLRPDMLCRAEFLPLPQSEANSDNGSRVTSSGVQLFVPSTSLLNRESQAAQVWTVGLQDQRLDLREISVQPSDESGVLRVLEGLNPGDRIVLNPAPRLSDGKRIRPILTDYSL